jgi:Abnormal spindle-like microcephaly-assoc'd, ASPM-SPD-2-Hydin
MPDRRRTAALRSRKLALLSLIIIASLGMSACAHVSSIPGVSQAQEPTAQAKIVLIPNSVDFSTVVVGQKNTQTVKLANSGTSNLQISNVQIAGQGLSIAGISFPLTLAPQASQLFNIEFAPASAGAVNGTLTVMSNLANPATVTVTGVGANAFEELQTNPVSINFGQVKVETKNTQTVIVTNSGNSNLAVNQVELTGSGFSLSGLPSEFELAPRQEISFLVLFGPQVKGTVTGYIKFIGKELYAPVSIALSGDGTAAGSTPPSVSHTVKLQWDASPGNISGYDVYRAGSSGGPYTKLTASPIDKLEYVDSDVVSGHEYFYVVTSLNSGGNQSKYSTQISVSIPAS